MNTWVLLRGLLRDSRHWGDFPALLGQQQGVDQVIALDLPGNGTLHRQSSPARVERMVDAYRAQLAEQAIDPPFHLLGLSLGAMAAAAWARHHPQEVAGAVLINTSLRPFAPFWRRLRPHNYPALLRMALPGADARRCEQTILRLTSSDPARHAPVLDAWTAYRKDCPVSARNAARQLLAAMRYRAPRDKPPVPLLLLASRGDRLVDPACSLRIARRWCVPLALHPSAGHDLPLDDPAWVAAQAAAYFRRNSTGW